jgi:hypothetical protein
MGWNELLTRIKNRRDFFGGGVIALFGLVGVIEGHRLGMGTLSKMGPGFVPLSLGVLLIGLGVLMATDQTNPKPGTEVIFQRPEWRGWLCIVAGVASFIVLGQYAGLVPAAFFSVLISALGDRTATLKGAILLSIGTTVFGVALFHYLLTISIPLFWW